MNASSKKISAKVLAHLSNFLETVNTPLRTSHDFDTGEKEYPSFYRPEARGAQQAS